MNKIIKTIFVALTTIGVLVLTGCTDDFKTPTLEEVRAVALRTTVTVSFTTFDQDEMLTDLKLTLTGVDSKGEDYSDVKTVTISGGLYATEEDLEQDPTLESEQFLGEEESITFSGLETGYKYTISFVGTYNDKVREMYDDVEVSTSEKGGSVETAWEITTYEELNTTVRDDSDGYFILKNDIDCSNTTTDKARELKPLFSSSKKFEGSFDGQGYKISNFYQDSYDQDLGLFGNIGASGKVFDLDIENVDLNSSRYTNFYAGAVAGTNTGEITDVNVMNITITTKGPDDGVQYVGGFVGQNKDAGTITNCTVTVGHLNLNVPNDGRIGGFVGSNEASTNSPSVVNCSTNVLIDVQIPTQPSYTADDEGVEINLSIGGFVGRNTGNVNEGETSSKIIIYVDKTATDKEFNETEFSDDNLSVENVERLPLIGKISLNLGGFVGVNQGHITDSKTSVTEVVADVPFVDELRVGGFVGYNEFFGVISGSLINSSVKYSIIVGEDTILNEEVKDNSNFDGVNDLTMNYIGTFVGLNSNEVTTVGSIVLSSGCTVTVSVSLRYSWEEEVTTEDETSPATDEVEYETVYDFEDLSVKLNGLLEGTN